MLSIIVRLVVNAIALWITAALIDGVQIDAASTQDQVITVIIVAAIFGVINTLVKPVVKLLSLPAYVLTLGLFTFVVNALMLWLTSWISGELDVAFHVDGFWPAAVLGALVVTVVSWLLNLLLPD